MGSHILLLYLQNDEERNQNQMINYQQNTISHTNEDNNDTKDDNTSSEIRSSPSSSNGINRCLMIGIPIEMPQEELSSFLEPYLGDITNIMIIQDLNLEGCKSAVIQFREHDSMDSFCRLYSNLHFPSHSTAAPCIVFPLQDCIISNDIYHSSSPKFSADSEQSTSLSTNIPSSPPSILSLPVMERGISSESHHSNVQNTSSRDNERLTWILSPPPPNFLQLPNCPICLRRIISRVSHINEEEAFDECDKLIIGPSFIGHGDRCRVCHIYSDTSSSLRICNVCGLRENLWTCLQCGYTGCGRYTSQHAKKHFHHQGHPFSLELATGRIWDYVHDTFVHIDPLSEFSPQTLPNNRTDNYHFDTSFDKAYSIYPLSSSTNTLVSTAHSKEEWTKFNLPNEDSNTLFHSSVSENANGKMRLLQQDYEDLLVSQLTEQRLYYEKLLAQNTVHLLESGHHIPAVEDLFETSSISSTSTSAITDTSIQWTDHADQELETIQNIKLDISRLEYEYSLILQQIRLAEMKALELRKINDKLVAKQKIQRQRITDYTERAEELKKREENKIESLEQEIKDLDFFLRARDQINSSGLRDEVKSGVMVVQQGRDSSAYSTSRNLKNQRKKKGGR